MFTQYASGRNKLPFTNSNITITNDGALGISGTFYISIQGENRIGLNLNSNLIPVTVTPTSKITISLPAVLSGEDWQNIILSASTTNDVTTLTQICKIAKIDFETPLILNSSNVFKLTTSERTVANPGLLPSVVENGLIRYVESLLYYNQYNRYSTKVAENVLVLPSTIGKWERIGSMNTYQSSTGASGGCDQDVRTPNLTVNAPSYAVDGSKGEGVTYWIRNDSDQEISSGTRISGIVRLYEEDRSQLFDSLIILELVGYVNLTTGVLDNSVYSGEVLYSPKTRTLTLPENLPSNNAVAVKVSPKFKPEHLNNQVPYLANLEIYLTFAPVTGVYAPGSQLFGNIIYNEYDKFRVVPQKGLSAKVTKGSGLLDNYELIAVSEGLVSGVLMNTANQYVYLTSNGTSFCTTNSNFNNAIKRAKISTLNGISNPINYGSITLDATKKLNISLNLDQSIRYNYPDILAGSNKGVFNASYVVIYLKNSNNNYYKYEAFIQLNSTSLSVELDFSDFTNIFQLNTNTNEFGLYGLNSIVINSTVAASTFPSTNYQVYIALKYESTVTSISHSVSEAFETELNISNIFENASSWHKAVSNKSELREIPRNEITNYQACYVFENNYIYFFNPAQSATDDNDLIIRVDTNLGAWVRYSVNASKWITGNTPPSSTLGNIDDLYLNIFTGDYYRKSDSITWTFLSSLKINWLTGEIIPANTLGNVGDFYIDLNTSKLYSKTNVTVWTYLRKLRVDWLNGIGAPATSLGNNGDYYIDTVVNNYYFKKDNSWTLIGSLSPTFSVDTVTSLSAGSTATVNLTKSTTSNNYKFDFGIPKGKNVTVSVGSVTSVSSSNQAQVYNVGNSENAILDFEIPKGYTPAFTIGDVITLNSNQNATANIQFLSEPSNYKINLGIPKGITPTLTTGVTTTLEPNQEATSTIVTTSIPNQYRLNLGIPKGLSATFVSGAVTQLNANDTPYASVYPTGNPSEYGIAFGLVPGHTSTFIAGTATSLEATDNPTSTVTLTNNPNEYQINLGIPQGVKGDVATITVGTITTVANNIDASIVNTGTVNNAIFDFSIPRGAIPTLINGAVTSVDPLDNPDVIINPTSTPGEYEISFSIPRGRLDNPPEWGQIIGTLSSQPDLQVELTTKANKVVPGWTSLSLETGWNNSAVSGDLGLSVRKLDSGLIEIRGTVFRNPTTAPQLIAILPTEFRPSYNLGFAVRTGTSVTSIGSTTTISIDVNGNIRNTASGTTSLLYIEYIYIE